MKVDPQKCLGWDRCDICGKIKPLWLYFNQDIGMLIEIMPEGRPELRCEECIPATK